MSRSLRSFLPLDVAPAQAVAAFTDAPGRWLPPARHVGADRFVTEVGAGGLERPVAITVGSPWHVGSTWWRSLRWEPLDDLGDGLPLARLLPRMEAEIGLAVRGDQHVTLLLDGRYDPPGGRFGEAVDVVALGRLARATVDRLLADVAGRLAEVPAALVR